MEIAGRRESVGGGVFSVAPHEMGTPAGDGVVPAALRALGHGKVSSNSAREAVGRAGGGEKGRGEGGKGGG